VFDSYYDCAHFSIAVHFLDKHRVFHFQKSSFYFLKHDDDESYKVCNNKQHHAKGKRHKQKSMQNVHGETTENTI
jgi:hypothetical protein